MQRMRFSTDGLPVGMDDRARFSLWHDLCVDNYCSLQLARPHDRPFSVTFQAMRFGDLRLGHFQGTVNDVARTPRHVAADGSDDFFFGFSRRGRMSFHQHGRETIVAPGAATLLNDSHAGGWKTEDENEWVALTLSRKQLLTMAGGAEDLLAAPIADSPALRHLRRYLDTLVGAEDIGADPALGRHLEATLLDLVALALGANGDVVATAQKRGLRAARVHAIIAEIRRHCADPAFSVARVARKLGFSERYVQDLLHEDGGSFSERVMELRLQRARAMLLDPRNDPMRIVDIALQSGFSDLSNFNRYFRRRFGATPTQMRGGTPGDAPA